MGRNREQTESILNTANTLRWEFGENFHDDLLKSIYDDASKIAGRAITATGEKPRLSWEQALDRLVTNRWTGFPIMLLLLTAVFWITISGANIPSRVIASVLIDTIHPALKSFSVTIGLPWWLSGVLIDGMYLSMAWVVSVMLPPMAIFFPMFTLLEDFGYLPRVAFNMDNIFRKVGAHGKQALTMSMGYGCNAAGIIATRIIDSPRERLIAIITNNFSLCNGRWPTQILIATLFIGSLVPAMLAGLVSASAVVAIALLGIALTFITSWFLSHTILKGEASAFSLELPPYRPPRILQTLYTSLIDRTIFVLWRAVVFAVPAGAVIWLIANITISGTSIANHIVNSLNPFGIFIGLNGVILLAYVIAIPANEIVIPTILMLTVLSARMAGVGEGAGVMFEFNDLSSYLTVFNAGGWTLLTAVNLMLFSLIHNPCSTTIYTIYKETRSIKWTIISALLPVVMGLALCFFVAQIWRLIA
jgi:ferrous iron transport protein B